MREIKSTRIGKPRGDADHYKIGHLSDASPGFYTAIVVWERGEGKGEREKVTGEW
jgi:hypothetical protein